MHGASNNSFILQELEAPRTADSPDDEAHALLEEARRRARRRRRRNALSLVLLAAVVAGAALVVAPLGDDARGPADHEQRPGPAVRPPTKLLVQLLTPAEPLAVVDPRNATARVLELPTAGGDWPDRVHRAGDRFVWQGPSGTYAIGSDLRGRGERLASSSFVVPSGTPGRLWFLSAGADRGSRGEATAVVEMTVRGRVTRRSTLRLPCRGAVVAALVRALVCQDRRSLLAFDPASGKAIRRVRGLFPLGAHGNVVAACTARCAAVQITDVETGRRRAIPPPSPYRFLDGYDGAFSPDGSWLAVPVAARARGGDGDLRRLVQVALVDVRRGTTQVIPGSRLAAVYRKLAWSSSGDLYFAASRGRIMVHRPGARRAQLLSVRLRAPILDLAAN